MVSSFKKPSNLFEKIKEVLDGPIFLFYLFLPGLLLIDVLKRTNFLPNEC